jgi:hypothetical protein
VTRLKKGKPWLYWLLVLCVAALVATPVLGAEEDEPGPPEDDAVLQAAAEAEASAESFWQLDFDVCIQKFYDRNANGEWDAGEPFLTKDDGWEKGWAVKITNNRTGWYKYVKTGYSLQFGWPWWQRSYTVTEMMPAACGGCQWVASTDTSAVVTLMCHPEHLRFGNYCLCDPCGRTPGFWQNKNGEAEFKKIGGLAIVNALPLVDGSGTVVTPFADYAAFRAWLRASNAGDNMAYKLSAHLAAMALNVAAGFVKNPGDVGVVVHGEWTSITDLLAAAADLLADNPLTEPGDPDRAHQGCVKDLLDGLNSNCTKVIPYDPCCYTFDGLCFGKWFPPAA